MVVLSWNSNPWWQVVKRETALKTILTILLTLTLTICWAQDTLKIRVRADSVLGKLDSLRFPQFQLTDTLSNRLHKADSTKAKVVSKYDSLASIVNKPQEELDSYVSKINSLQSRLTQKIDSLISLPDPDKLLIGNLDSLRGRLDSLKQSGMAKYASNAAGKVKQAQERVDEKINSIEQKVNEKLSLFSGNGADAGSLDLPSTGGLPDVDNPLDKLDISVKLPGGSPANDMDLDYGGLNGKIGELGQLKETSNIPKEKLGELTNIEGIKEVQDKAGKVSEVTGQINGYTGDAKNLAQGSVENLDQLPEALEEKVASLEEMEDVQKEVAPANDYMEMIKKWNSDPEVAKELALNKAKEQAVNHFAGHEEQLRAALDKMIQVKEKFKNTDGIIDMMKKRQRNAVKGKPLVERLIPGIGLQVQKENNLWADFNPYIGYKLTGRLAVGVGWNERIGINTKSRKYVEEDRVYGIRSFIQFRLKEGLLLNAEVETMNALMLPTSKLPPDEIGKRNWVHSYFAGIKKEFRFSKAVKGTVQALYNIYDPDNKSPYINRLNVRFGFEFPMKQVKNRRKSLL